MKTKEKKEKSIMLQLREIRDRISLEIKNMSAEEIMEYFKKRRLLHPTMYKEQ